MKRIIELKPDIKIKNLLKALNSLDVVYVCLDNAFYSKEELRPLVKLAKKIEKDIEKIKKKRNQDEKE